MIWTLVLVPVSILGVWLAAHHWYGWAISFVSEFLWAAYALSLHSLSLLIMSGVWSLIHARNTWSTYRKQRVRRHIEALASLPWHEGHLGYRVSDGIVVREGPALHQLRPPTGRQ